MSFETEKKTDGKTIKKMLFVVLNNKWNENSRSVFGFSIKWNNIRNPGFSIKIGSLPEKKKLTHTFVNVIQFKSKFWIEIIKRFSNVVRAALFNCVYFVIVDVFFFSSFDSWFRRQTQIDKRLSRTVHRTQPNSLFALMHSIRFLLVLAFDIDIACTHAIHPSAQHLISLSMIVSYY